MVGNGIVILLLLAASSLAQDTPPSQNLSISGVVKSGSSLIPGATVTARNSSTGEKTATTTDINGAYTLAVSGSGKYEMRVEMPALRRGRGRLSLKARPDERMWN